VKGSVLVRDCTREKRCYLSCAMCVRCMICVCCMICCMLRYNLIEVREKMGIAREENEREMWERERCCSSLVKHANGAQVVICFLRIYTSSRNYQILPVFEISLGQIGLISRESTLTFGAGGLTPRAYHTAICSPLL
jgi:hypothetical protein